MLDDLENIPVLTGDLLYLGAAIRQLFRFRGLTIDIATAAGARGARAHLMLIIANGKNFGGMFQIAPDARIDDGLLDAISILDASPLTRISMLAAAPSGKHVRNRARAVGAGGELHAYLRRATGVRDRRRVQPRVVVDDRDSCVPRALRVATPAEA